MQFGEVCDDALGLEVGVIDRCGYLRQLLVDLALVPRYDADVEVLPG